MHGRPAALHAEQHGRKARSDTGSTPAQTAPSTRTRHRARGWPNFSKFRVVWNPTAPEAPLVSTKGAVSRTSAAAPFTIAWDDKRHSDQTSGVRTRGWGAPRNRSPVADAVGVPASAGSVAGVASA